MSSGPYSFDHTTFEPAERKGDAVYVTPTALAVFAIGIMAGTAASLQIGINSNRNKRKHIFFMRVSRAVSYFQ
jgi:hypothetical protein